MNTITKSNEELLTFLVGNNSLLSGSIKSIEISSRFDGLDIIVFISLLYPGKSRSVKLIFKNILEYLFYYTSQYSFYDIERYKFFQTERGFYISFDPFDEDNEVSLEDQDYILAESVAGEIQM